MSSAHFNRGPAYGLSAEVKNKVGLRAAPGLAYTLCQARGPALGVPWTPSCLSHVTWNLREKRDKCTIEVAFLPLLSIPKPTAAAGGEGGVGGYAGNHRQTEQPFHCEDPTAPESPVSPLFSWLAGGDLFIFPTPPG